MALRAINFLLTIGLDYSNATGSDKLGSRLTEPSFNGRGFTKGLSCDHTRSFGDELSRTEARVENRRRAGRRPGDRGLRQKPR
ncbi:hypothetical protein MPC4_20136 [Methylocella tundrae]|uniref:Uncharacterized protein n=1 Tax=Methylocella tundrae TaxID=227605 RepID=A0A8B6M572_METTU|nr:hypothetical protein MPC1_9190002 [Methylocella tundrae]VTZ49926.1 hypothetical protein MPC4_20136 [Methylocella tundrae]